MCGVMDPPLASTMPRSTSSFAMPRRSKPALSPASPSSSCFLNISTRHVPLPSCACRGSRQFPLPRPPSPCRARLRPVTTGAAPLNRKNIFNRHQERLIQLAPPGRECIFVDRLHQRNQSDFSALLFAISARPERRNPHHRNVVSLALGSLPTVRGPSSSTNPAIRASAASTLFNATTRYGTPTCRASSTCSRVCGIGPSVGRHHQNAAIICARP